MYWYYRKVKFWDLKVFIERFILLCPLFGVSFIGGSTVYLANHSYEELSGVFNLGNTVVYTSCHCESKEGAFPSWLQYEF